MKQFRIYYNNHNSHIYAKDRQELKKTIYMLLKAGYLDYEIERF